MISIDIRKSQHFFGGSPSTMGSEPNLYTSTLEFLKLQPMWGSASSWQDLPTPLISPVENSPNPYFVVLLSLIVEGLIAIYALYQLVMILFRNKFGPHRIKYSFGSSLNRRSSGLLNIVKIYAVVLHVILTLLLGWFSFSNAPGSASAIFSAAILSFIILPLHYSEITRSAIPHASLLLFWLFDLIISISWLLQDLYSPYKIIVNEKNYRAEGITIEILLVINAFIVFLLEKDFHSTKELIRYFEANGWDYTTQLSLFSDLFISWVEPIMTIVYNENELDQEMIPHLSPDLKANYNYNNFLKNWNVQLKKPNPSLPLAILTTYWYEFFVVVSFNMAEIAFSLMQPFLLRKLLVYFNDVTNKENETHQPFIVGLTIVFGIFLIPCLFSIAASRSFITMIKFIFRLQSSLSCLVYEKAIKLTPEARKQKTSGDIVNHLATDVPTIENMSNVFKDLINTPIYLVLCLLSLFALIGKATWGGVLAAVILVPMSTKISTAIYDYYDRASANKDERIQLTSEILNSIKSVKLYAWEKPMLRRLDEIRNDKELVSRKSLGIFNALSTFMWSCLPFLVSCASFGTFVWISDVPLTPEKIFPAMAVFELLSEPLTMLPYVISDVIEINVSFKRLLDYFLLPEIASKIFRTHYDVKKGDTVINVDEASFLWEEDSESYALKNINLLVKSGQLLCVVGRIGSGKSALLRSLLGEIYCKSFKSLSVNGSIAYCSQTPWILNATVKENITFGSRFNKALYDKTVTACELSSDFETLPDGDETSVGEKGISLSGGQKARLSLARAVYANADVYLLDDILAAVDAHVGKNIIKNVLGKKGVLASKTVIISTNSVKILPQADNIVYLAEGSITERGTLKELLAAKGSLEALIREHVGDNVNLEEEEDILDAEDLDNSIDDSLVKEFHPTEGTEEITRRRTRASSTSSAVLPISLQDEVQEELGIEHAIDIENELESETTSAKKTGQTIEIKNSGQVDLSIYWEYFRACNYQYITFYVILLAGSIGCTLAGNLILKTWSEKNQKANDTINAYFFLSFYVASGVIGGAMTLVAAYIVWTYCILRGSKHFHDTMAYAILRSPMSFFETTPIGRILNRFSEDIGQMDSQLPWTMIDLVEFVLQGITVLFVIVYNVPLMFFVILILLIIYNGVRKYFIPTSRELRRLLSARRSPIFSTIQESVNGVESLRAYLEQERFKSTNEGLHDSKNSAHFFLYMCNRWLSIKLAFISAALIGLSALMVICSVGTRFQLNSALVGLVMSYALSTSDILRAIVRRWAEVETKTVSIERVVEYCNLKPEAPLVIEQNQPHNWPRHGEIKFVDYSTKYRENLDPVLKHINLSINPGEKVGIAGRTGAGKSSLTLALFRIIEATEGHIEIDAISTNDIGLLDLRLNLSIIPQDAHTIEGSVRLNLDPFGNYSDVQLLKALELAHLKDHVLSMETDGNKGLDAQIFESGSNLSAGQKQLLCLARALLNPSKVLILDEATASVDVQTDKIIQETIRTEFKDKTILTIAHRLDTIMDSDRIIVLDKGEVKEFGAVDELLKEPEGIFRGLCERGGYLQKTEKS